MKTLKLTCVFLVYSFVGVIFLALAAVFLVMLGIFYPFRYLSNQYRYNET